MDCFSSIAVLRQSLTLIGQFQTVAYCKVNCSQMETAAFSC